MANVNLETGNIFGVEKQTKKYYHEIGHLKFEEDYKFGNKIRVIQDLSLKTLIFSTALKVISQYILFNYLIILYLLLNIFSELYEEYWCWKYASNRMNPKGKKDDTTTRTISS